MLSFRQGIGGFHCLNLPVCAVEELSSIYFEDSKVAVYQTPDEAEFWARTCHPV